MQSSADKPDLLLLAPDELALILAYRDQKDAFKQPPTHMRLKVDIDPNRVVCSIERRAWVSTRQIAPGRVTPAKAA